MLQNEAYLHNKFFDPAYIPILITIQLIAIRFDVNNVCLALSCKSSIIYNMQIDFDYLQYAEIFLLFTNECLLVYTPKIS